MERLRDRKPTGITGNALRIWGMVLLTLGTVGQSLLENKLLNLGNVSTEELLNAMMASEGTMAMASLALLLKAVSTCAVPVFALLLVEGFSHTGSFKNYFLRLLAAGVAAEIPFDLAMSGKLLDLQYQNPMLGMAVALVLLYFFDLYTKNSFQNVIIKILVLVAAMAWGWMLRIDDCTALLMITAVLWIFRGKPLYRTLAGAVVSIGYSAGSPFYLASPMGFLLIHFYNGERAEEENRIVRYASYPVMLLIVGLITKFVL